MNPSEISRKELDEDRDTVEQYIKIIRLYEDGLDPIIKKAKGTANKVLRVAQDGDRNIQAMTGFTVDADQIYLNLIVTAPWNLRMHAPNMEEHKALATKGGGTTLMRSVYQSAQALGKEKLSLKPMDGSYTYYNERLKMEDDPDGSCFYRVTEKVPEPLLRD